MKDTYNCMQKNNAQNKERDDKCTQQKETNIHKLHNGSQNGYYLQPGNWCCTFVALLLLLCVSSPPPLVAQFHQSSWFYFSFSFVCYDPCINCSCSFFFMIHIVIVETGHICLNMSVVFLFIP